VSSAVEILVYVMLNDLRYAIRTLVARPSFTAVAVLTLAIGIGANVAIFSLVSGVLLRPLPLEDPERLVVIWDTHPSLPVPFMVLSPPRVIAWRAADRVFEEVGGFAPTQMTLSESGLAEQVSGAAVYQGLLQALGVAPATGRFFDDADFRAEAPRAVILSDALWRRRFSADRGLVGRTVRLSGYEHIVVGIMPPRFHFVPSITIEGKPPIERPQFWVPQRVAAPETQRGAHFLTTIGRLRPGVTIASANRQMKELAARIAEEHPDERQWSVELVPLLAQATGALQPTLLTLVGAVAFVLLLACTNVANLLIARGIGRRRELAVRAALGASRWRLARQLFTESLVLSAAGGAAGLLVASWCVRFVRIYGPATITRLDEVTVDARVVAFAADASLVAAVLFGLAPLAQMLRAATIDSLKERSAGTTGTRIRSLLVVAEVSLAIVLLVGGVLLMQSFFHLQGIDPGFRPQQAMTFHVALPPEQYPSRAERVRFTEEAVRRLTVAPGVRSAGAIDSVPIAENRQGTDVTVDGMPEPPAGQELNAGFSFPTAGYFEAIGLPVLRGRGFTDRDRADSTPVIIVNETLARRLFGDADPIGRRLRAGFNHQVAREIVGIVADEHHTGLGRPAQPNVYTPYAQTNWNGGLSFVVRSTTDVATTVAAAREALRGLDPAAAIYGVRTLDEILSRSISTERFSAGLFAAFALAALALALIGVYGVTDQAVTQRTHELGVRIALGADGRRIRALVIGGSLRLSVAGIAIGVALALALSRVIAGQLVGVSPFDVRAYAAVVAVLALSGVAAAYLPARKAMKTDPMIALRAE
jgi:putative ABC transport system permease protein